MTFENYYVNGFKREGTITWTNTSIPPVKGWQRKVENGKITAPNGRYWLYQSLKDVTQIAGSSTPGRLDDEVSVAGNARRYQYERSYPNRNHYRAAAQSIYLCQY